MSLRVDGAAEPLQGSGVLVACFLASGALGLMYEVVWLRMLSLVFGHTTYAITTVLMAFMAGLALGSLLLGSRASQIKNPIRTYGWFEVTIGLFCAAVPLLLDGVSYLFLALHHALGLSYNAFSAVQFLLVFTLLLVPTTLMGGTLPILSQAVAKREASLGRIIGTLYGANTLGAVAGVALSGYVLLPVLGNRATTVVAAVGNVAVGMLAIVLSHSRGIRPQAISLEYPLAPQDVSGTVLRQRVGLVGGVVLIALGLSGAVSMIYEVTWTRALTLVIGSSTYAFTAILVTFLAGIAGGSALYAWLRGSRPSSPAVFGMLQAGIGVSTMVILLVFDRIPELFVRVPRWSSAPTFVQLLQLATAASTLLIPTLLIGATFPCAIALTGHGNSRIGEHVGRVYAVNTLGAIAGTALAGFILVPTIGVQTSITLGVTINLLLSIALFAAPPRLATALPWGSLVAALTATIIFVTPHWDQQVMSSGPAVYGETYRKEIGNSPLSEILRRRGDVLFYRDGISGTVSVLRHGENVLLRVNGKTDASTIGDIQTELMSGHLPLLVHPDPRRVLVIGLGSGITAGAVARHPIESLDVVEIEPAIIEASRFFAPQHGDVLKDPRVHTVIADGRNFLLTTSNRYDAIISEPSNPWIGGLASLFSVEFFQLARQHLKHDGIMLQWVQGYSLRPDDLRMIVKTFRTAFPATSIWNTSPGDFLLLGRRTPTPFDLGLVESRFSRIRSERLELRIQGWAGMLGYFMLGEENAEQFSEGAGLNTDDRLPLEFSAPLALYLDTNRQNEELLRSFKTTQLPAVTPGSRKELDRAEVRYWIGATYLARGILEDALTQFQLALQLDPKDTRSLLGVSQAYLGLRRAAEALDAAQTVVAREPNNADALFMAGLASQAQDARPEAIAFFTRAANLQPQNARFRMALRLAGGN